MTLAEEVIYRSQEPFYAFKTIFVFVVFYNH